MTKKVYPYYLDNVPVIQLILNDHNPRLPEYLHGKGEDKIIEHMLLEESTLKLMQAIGNKGFFKGEHLLVAESCNEKFKVIEGNRRLASVKLLNNPQLATAQEGLVKRINKEADKEIIPIDGLPCVVFKKDEDIHDYLGYKHITGIQLWNLKQKAKYLSYLRQKNFSKLPLDDACNELRKIVGTKKPIVKRYLVGYEIYSIIREKEFFKVKDLKEEHFYFSYITDSLERTHIAEYLGVHMESDKPIENLNINRLKNWTEWLYEPIEETSQSIKKTRLKGKSGDLNKLNSILENETAREHFIDRSAALEEAYSCTYNSDQIFYDFISDSLLSMKNTMEIISTVKDLYSTLGDDLIREIIMLSKESKSIKEFERDEFG